ncbi:CaiB/BaiF CoA transferase family protein [[Mycobacterium] vasticus]|uniref:CoA transferase n=1 Tax=[Mycobacterium] vasticus TaxID=2875777 RepID=A0ABU5YZS3_9MYCO|nr:CoA transferase [Mycolicibacter sp. MYC017]MEB3070644.1 CoA transferase [Mycolicibacter sp. MYC017]
MGGPLEGFRVVDCSRGLAGPRATGVLADYGAQVWWVEPPGGDPFREVLATEYAVFNRGKRGVQLDLKTNAGRDGLDGLLAGADLLVTSWRPGVTERLGLDWERVHERFPRLIYASITGFGEDGTLADVPGHEAIVQSYVGVSAEQVGLREPPIYEGLPFASIGAAYLAVIGSLAALYRRAEDGRGRYVQTSLVDGALSYLGMLWGDADNVSAAPPVVPGSIRLISQSFRCADDEYIGVHTGAVGAFGRLIGELGLGDRLAVAEDGSDMRIPLSEEERRIVLEEVPAVFETQPRDIWLKRLLAADVAAIPELRNGQIFDEPQVRHNNMVIEVEDPLLGPLEQVAPAIRFGGLDHRPVAGAPRVGQHDGQLPSVLAAEDAAVTAAGSAGGDRQPLLAGLRVLDAGAYYAGPFSSRLLADLGADVIKLETTLGDQLRGIQRPFRSASAGKRAISLNLKDPDLHAARDALIKWADVVLHNMRPGAAERVGLGYEHVHELNPQAVYLYAPGWGSHGPDATRQSFAPLMSGYVGIGYEVAGQYNPPMWPVGNEDPGNGLAGAVGILTALLHQTRSATGIYVENPQLNATMSHAAHIVRRPDGTMLGAERLDPLQTGIGPLDRFYETRDGWICVVALSDSEIRRLEPVLAITILDDPRWATHDLRIQYGYELADALSERFAQSDSQDWLTRLWAAGVAAMIPKTRSNNEAFHRDPINQAIGRIAQVTDTDGRFVREAATMVRVSGATPAPHRLAPEFGAHTDEILHELGYTPDKITELRHRGSIR